MLISVSSAAGKATLKKEIIATEPYVDPSAEWITVSSEATFVCGFFFNQKHPSLSNVINITNLKVEKLADRDLFRLTDAFSVSRIPELAASGIYSDLSGGPYYFYMDATDPNNVKVVNEVCQLGIVHNEYGAMSVGNDFNIKAAKSTSTVRTTERKARSESACSFAMPTANNSSSRHSTVRYI